MKIVGARGTAQWSDYILLAGLTLFSGFVWWLNEGYGVPQLRRERERLRKRLDQEKEKSNILGLRCASRLN